MSSQIEDPLIEKLRETIRSWSGEVTGAHNLLSQQIGDAREQLHTLLNTISEQNGEGALAPLSNAVNLELNERLLKAENTNQIFADELISQRKRNSMTANALKAAREEVEKLRKLNEIAQQEQSEMRKEVAELVAAADEIGALPESIDHERQESEQLISELNSRIEDWEKIGKDQLLKITRLQTDLEQKNTYEPKQLELKQEISELQNDILQLQVALSRSQEEAKNLREHPELTIFPELESLRMEISEKNASLAGLQDELDLAKANNTGDSQTNSTMRTELDTTRHQLANLRQSEMDLQSELNSLGHEYERQALSLTDATHELESHWQLQKESQTREQELSIQLDKIHEKMKEKDNSLNLAQHEVNELKESIHALTSNHDDIAADLQTYEYYLDSREKELEDSLKQIQQLEETALSLQAEIRVVRQEQEETKEKRPTPIRLVEEITHLRASLKEQSKVAEQRLQTIQEQSHLLQELQTHPLSSLQVTSSGMQDDSLTQALDEINQLRSALSKQDQVIAELKSSDTISRLELDTIHFSAYDPDGHRRSIGEILLHADIINQIQLDNALDEQKNSKQRRLGSILVEKGFIREEIVAQVVAGQLNLSFVRLKDFPVDAKAVSMLNAHIATQHQCFPVKADEKELTIAMSNPLDLIAIEDLEFATQLKIQPVVATLEDIKEAVIKYYNIQFPSKSASFDLKEKPSNKIQP